MKCSISRQNFKCLVLSFIYILYIYILYIYIIYIYIYIYIYPYISCIYRWIIYIILDHHLQSIMKTRRDWYKKHKTFFLAKLKATF